MNNYFRSHIKLLTFELIGCRLQTSFASNETKTLNIFLKALQLTDVFIVNIVKDVDQ